MLGLVLCLQNCKVKPYVLEFEFKEPVSTADSLDYIEAGEIGYTLYKEHCGSCHGITHNGQSAIPNFTEEELEEYNLKWQMNQGLSHEKQQDLSDMQLDNILTFLMYRKRY